jgi:hypothetical protein
MTHRILAIDPGTDKSGWVLLHDGIPFDCGISENANIFRDAGMWGTWGAEGKPHLAIEEIRSYGQAVGQSTLDTCVWIGRFLRMWMQGGPELSLADLRAQSVLIPRKEVLLHVCNRGNRVTDANVRRALLDRFGGDAADKPFKKGSPKRGVPDRPEGPLYMIRAKGGSHIWSALAIAVTRHDRYVDTRRPEETIEQYVKRRMIASLRSTGSITADPEEASA